VSIDIARGDKDASREERAISHDFANQNGSAATDIPDADVGPAVGARGGNDVGNAVAIDIAQGHADASQEVRIVGVEVGNLRVRGHGLIEDLDLWPARGIGSDHQLWMAGMRRDHEVAGKGIVGLSIDTVDVLVHLVAVEIANVRSKGQREAAGRRLSWE